MALGIVNAGAVGGGDASLEGYATEKFVEEKLGNYARVVNKNLLLNADFRDPVDTNQGYLAPPGTAYYTDTGLTAQAGTLEVYTTAVKVDDVYGTVTVGGATYYVDWSQAVRGYAALKWACIDRWTYTNASVNNGATLVLGHLVRIAASTDMPEANRMMHQYVERPEAYVGKTLTASCLIPGVVGKGWYFGFRAVVGDAVRDSYAYITAPGLWRAEFTPPEGVTEIIVTFSCGGSGGTAAGDYIDIVAAKLELGTEQTLAHQDENGAWVLNEPVNKAYQLMLCSQYDSSGNFKDSLYVTEKDLEERLSDLVGEITPESINAAAKDMSNVDLQALAAAMGATRIVTGGWSERTAEPAVLTFDFIPKIFITKHKSATSETGTAKELFSFNFNNTGFTLSDSSTGWQGSFSQTVSGVRESNTITFKSAYVLGCTWLAMG